MNTKFLTQRDMVNNLKGFWRYVNLKKGSSNIPPTMTYNKCLVPGPKILLMVLQHFFNLFSIHLQISTENEIITALDKLKRKNTAGPHRMPSIFLKDCCPTLVKPLFILCNKILTNGVIPKSWKISKTVPIRKPIVML